MSMDRASIRSEVLFTSSSRPGSRAPPPAAAAPVRQPGLRHPGQQHEVQPAAGGMDPQAQRVVALLLRELDAARAQGTAATEELARLRSAAAAAPPPQKQQPARRRSDKGGRVGGTAPAAPTSGLIEAFRPPGVAPPPPPRKQRPTVPAPAACEEQALQALQRDNLEMRGHLEALYTHCRHLQHQLDAAAAPPPPQPAPSRRAQAPADAGSAGSPQRRPRSPPGRATVVVASPRADGVGADLAVALFEVRPGRRRRVQATGACWPSHGAVPPTKPPTSVICCAPCPAPRHARSPTLRAQKSCGWR